MRRPLDPNKIPDGLRNALSTRDCVLYLGSGFGAQASLPTWTDFIREMIDWSIQNKLINNEYSQTLKMAAKTESPDLIADSLLNAFNGKESILKQYLETIYFDTRLQPSGAHNMITKIPFCAIIDTGYDNLVRMAYSNNIQTSTLQDAERLLGSLTRREFFHLKIYGTLDSDRYTYLSESQLRQMVTSDKLMMYFFEALFFSRTILFIGCSFEGIKTFLSYVPLRKEQNRPHYALVAVNDDTWETTAEFLQRRHNVEIIPYKPTPEHPQVLRFLSNLVMEPPRSDLEPITKRSSYLKSTTLNQIGSFENITIDFDSKCNILLGDNGVGKSTILKALAVANAGKDAEPYASRLIKQGYSEGSIIIESSTGIKYMTRISRTDKGAEIVTIPGRPLELEGWMVLGFPPMRYSTWARTRDIPPAGQKRPTVNDILPLIQSEADPRLDKLKEWIVRLDYLISKSTDNRSKQMYVRQRDEFFKIIDKLTPNVKIQFNSVDPQTNEVRIVTDDGILPIEAVSQGTSSLLSWVGVLLQRLYDVFSSEKESNLIMDIPPTNRSALVLIDEIDAHMHPSWQRLIIPSLKEIFPNVQFIATTHSPLIVGGLPPGQVTRLLRDKNATIIKLPLEPDMTMGRADQLLTSELFGLETTVDQETEKKLEKYRELLSNTKRNKNEESEFQQLRRIIGFRLGSSAQSPPERRAEELLNNLLTLQFDPEDDERKKKILESARKLLTSIMNERVKK